MTGTLFSLEVQPRLPQRLSRLQELANDLFYSWEPQILRLFERLDSELWESSGHNPKVFLRRVSQERLEAAVEDRVFIEDYNRALSVFDTYHNEPARSEADGLLDRKEELIAYFCAEFGLHESLPIYSGGLGILAGDHCKAASDLDLPFIAVGMLYRQGYFTQTIDDQGNQQAHYLPNHFDDLPITPARDAAGHEIHVRVEIQQRPVELKVWHAKAGHIDLYLLDSDLPVNSEQDQRITHQLYGGGKSTRIQQEIVLGIGGVRALRALGLAPTVWHINEGHAAFQILERCREHIGRGHDFHSALELTGASTVFTTHTPVPAGHDIFDHELMLEYFQPMIAELGLETDQFLALGAYPGDPNAFNQTALALRGSRFHNGVSKIHGKVAAEMEGYVWPEIPAEENPITSITNGVHVPTFLASEWATLFDKHLGADWRNQLCNETFWRSIDNIPDHVFWSVHQALKLELFEEIKQRSERQHRRNGCSDAQINRLTHHLNHQESDVLVIGFARRFATYKRAALLFSDPDRLARLVNNPACPLVLVFAGKAHPKDQPGQDLIRTIHHFSRQPRFEGKIILLEGYDIALARKLVAGVDVWLNTPEFPMEASGTSGQKAGINGGINLSVLDGWWGEGYVGDNGWAIQPHGPEFDSAFRDYQEGQDLLSLLEHRVIPLYYSRLGQTNSDFERRAERPRHGYSEGWVKMSKASMKTIVPRFNSRRMVLDYVRNLYCPAATNTTVFSREEDRSAKQLARWKQQVRKNWDRVRLRRLDDQWLEKIYAGDSLPIRVAAALDGLRAEDVVVECVVGRTDAMGVFRPHECHAMQASGEIIEGDTVFQLDLMPSLPGLQQYKIRIYPHQSLLSHAFETGCMRWL